MASMFSAQGRPLVSVVTPVYNGEKYLSQCIESVLAQDYTNWEYLVIDNCSTDDSFAIASEYARRDSRVLVERNQHHLKAVTNWNHGIAKMSAVSAYCKVLHADDHLFPHCLSRMVAIAESNPTVSVVGCQVLVKVERRSLPTIQVKVNTELPFSGPVVAAKEVAREFLSSRGLLTCTPSSLLVRWDSRRRARPLYDESTGILSAVDRQVLLELLEDGDYGFAPEILICAREHEKSMTSTVYDHGVSCAERLRLLSRFRHSYLSDSEYQEFRRRQIGIYYSFLGRNVFLRRDKRFWKFHRELLRNEGCSLNPLKLLGHAAGELFHTARERMSRWGQRSQISPTSI
jgi:glycosyltransferase involved in cell wall biosynthesis